MADYTEFSTFSLDSPVSLDTTNGILLSDSLNDWRKKTNGIIEKVKNVDITLSAVNTNAAKLNVTTAQQFNGAITNTVATQTITGSTFNLDLGASNIHVLTLQSTSTMSFTNAASGTGGCYTIIIRNEGNYDIDFPDNVYFSGGDPILTTGTGSGASAGVDIISGIYDGTNFYAAIQYDIEASTGS